MSVKKLRKLRISHSATTVRDLDLSLSDSWMISKTAD